jgi:protein SCO1
MPQVSARTILVLLSLLLVASWAGVTFLRPSSGPLAIDGGIALNPRRSLPDFSLVDQHGAAFTRASLNGRWSLAFAGFTACPDLCPATLGILSALDTKLGDAASGLQTLLISVDPERDTPRRMAEFLDHFPARFGGITGEPAELDRLITGLGLSYIKVPIGAENYTVDHSAALVLVDPHGRVAAYFKPPLNPERLAADLAPLLAARR